MAAPSAASPTRRATACASRAFHERCAALPSRVLATRVAAGCGEACTEVSGRAARYWYIYPPEAGVPAPLCVLRDLKNEHQIDVRDNADVHRHLSINSSQPPLETSTARPVRPSLGPVEQSYWSRPSTPATVQRKPTHSRAFDVIQMPRQASAAGRGMPFNTLLPRG